MHINPCTCAICLTAKFIAVERQRAQAAHGPMVKDHSRALNILTEEVGECAAAYLVMTRPDYSTDAWIHFVEELAQVVAVATFIMQNVIQEHNSGK